MRRKYLYTFILFIWYTHTKKKKSTTER